MKINKIQTKRIKIILSGLVISIFTFSLQQAEKIKNQEIIQTTATPVSGKTVILDAGHGTPDERSRK